jgi:hypothetical protein
MTRYITRFTYEIHDGSDFLLSLSLLLLRYIAHFLLYTYLMITYLTKPTFMSILLLIINYN